MARVNYKGFPTDPSGNKLSGIDIEVNFQSTGLPADVYAAETGGSPIAQPFQTATDGSFEFWADPGDYTIVAGTGPTQQTLPITLTEPLSEGGTILFGDGSAATPSITNVGDTDTGFFFPADNEIGMSTAGVEALRINDTQRVLIGATSLIGSERLLVAGASSEVALNATSGAATIRFREAGTERAKIASLGGSGGLLFESAGSEAMRLNSSGNLGLGTSSPTGKFTIASGASDHIRLEGTSGDAYGLWTSATGTSLTVGSWNNGARINMFDSSEVITFGVGAASEERMRLTATGLGLGTSSPTDSLHVVNSSASVADAQVNLEGATGGYGTGIRFTSQVTGGGLVEMAKIVADGSDSWNTTASTQDARLTFHTTNDGVLAERMRIDSSGNVGIGTTSPDSDLEVAASTATTIRITNTDNTISQNDGALLDFHFEDDTTNGTGRAGRVAVLSEDTFGVDSYMVFETRDDGDSSPNSAERMRITAEGNVGIGTTSPDHTLRVVGDGRIGNLHIKDAEYTAGTGKAIWADGAGSGVLGLNSSTAIQFNTNNTESMRIEGSGRVGIGTSAPSAKLAVVGGVIRCDSGSASESLILTGTGSNFQVSHATSGYATLLNSGGGLAFSTNGSEALRIDSSGNVGIGLTNPSFYSGKLTVAGNLAISGGNRALFWNSVGDGLASIQGVGTNELAFMTSGSYTERMRIDSSGNVGIGTSSPSSQLHLLKAGGTTIKLGTSQNTSEIEARESGASNLLVFSSNNSVDHMTIDSSGNVGVGTSSPAHLLDVSKSSGWSPIVTRSSTLFAGISSDSAAGGNDVIFSSGSPLRFATVSDSGGTGYTERMRIDSSGNLLVGKTVTTYTTDGFVCQANSGGNTGVSATSNSCFYANRNGTDGDSFIFFKSGTQVGSISVTSSATSYNTTSDARLKENIQDAGQSGETIDAIRVVQHDWKADGSHVDFGFIAQELNEVYPDAVTVPDDPEEMQSVDYSKLVPLLLKEIQDLRKRVKELEEE